MLPPKRPLGCFRVKFCPELYGLHKWSLSIPSLNTLSNSNIFMKQFKRATLPLSVIMLWSHDQVRQSHQQQLQAQQMMQVVQAV